MNTDNTSISGETIDYGPCAFMDDYDPATVFSSIDESGRYAFANQPRIAQWNLARLAEALLPLFADDEDEAVELAQAALDAFRRRVRAPPITPACARSSALRRDATATRRWRSDLLERMAENQVDFTLTFRRLCDAAADADADAAVARCSPIPPPSTTGPTRWRAAAR